MSRAYRVAVKGGIERTIHIDDSVQAPLELLPILPKERTSELLAAELEKRGFEREGSIMRRRDGETTVEIDLEGSTIAVRQESELELQIRRERVMAMTSPAQVAAREKELKQQLEKELETEAKEQIEEARKKATEALEGALRDIKKEIDDVVNRVTAEALKEKARGMGEIEEMVEGEDGSLTIKVRL